jgi:serine/threonine protein kinase
VSESENISNQEPPESSIKDLPDKFVSDLLGGALQDDDPRMRDFGERYDFREILGKGGQGIVLSVKDKLLDREVALKTIKGHANKLREEYIEREARISGNLEHPNIPPTYDLGLDETGSPFFVMRKVEGVSLDVILKEKKSSLKGSKSSFKAFNKTDSEYSVIHLLSVFIQVCNAIEFAHSRRVLHLDIKPQNIKLGSFGEVFVLDWGFAAIKNEEQKLVGGTPIYIAPERFRREKPDERSDIYSLGVLLYRMLTLCRPYDLAALSFKDFCAKYDSLELISPRERDRSIPQDLEAIILKAMSRKRDDRYSSVKELSTDLQRFLDGLPVTAFESSFFSKTWKAVKRHPAVSMLITALLIALLSIAAIARHNYNLNKQRRKEAKVRRKNEAKLLKARELRNSASIPYQKGRDYLDKTPPQLQGARRFFSKAISIDPEFTDAYFERGKVHSRLGNSTEALADFRQTLNIKPDFIMAHYHAGILLMDVVEFRDLTAAENEFQIMQSIDPDNEYSNLGLARIHILNNELQTALELCSRIEARNPDFKEVNYLKGYIFGKKRGKFYQPKNALKYYDIYLDNIKDNIAAYLNRGDLRQRVGDIAGALADYNKSLELNPDYVWALNNRGWIYYSVRHDTDKALADFNKASDVRPEYYWTYMNRAAVYEYLNDWNKAEEDYNWASDLRPDSSIVMERKGLCYFRQGRYDAALKSLLEARTNAASGKTGSIDFHIGLVLTAKGDERKAVGFFDASLKSETNPYKFNAALLRHIILVKSGNNPDPNDLSIYIESDGKIQHKNLARCWRGIVTPEGALKGITEPAGLCEVSFYNALYYKYVMLDKRQYLNSLKHAIKTGINLYNEYVLATEELKKHNKSIK